MQNLSVKNLDLIPGIVQRGELTPELARRGRDISPEHAQYLFDCARHESAHVIAAWACAQGWASGVYINPAKKHRQRYRSPANADCGAAMLEHEAFISLAGPAIEDLMALERGVNADEQSRIASASDIKRGADECRQIGVEFHVIHRAISLFVGDARLAIDHMTVAILLLSTKSGVLGHSKLKHLRPWMRKHHPLHYDSYGPHPKVKMPNLAAHLPADPFIDKLLGGCWSTCPV